MIKAEHLTKHFDTPPDTVLALDDFSTEIGSGSIYGLIGPNGSGKSTLLRLIAGVYRPDGGSLEVDGQSVFENEHIKERIFFVSDDFFYFPGATVDEMAALYAGFYPNWSWERYAELSGKFPLERKRKLQTFSKGMARQAALLLGLSAQTPFLLLDEAFDGLDPIIRTAVRMMGSSPSKASSRRRKGVCAERPNSSAAWRAIPFEKVWSFRFLSSGNFPLNSAYRSHDQFG